MTPWHGRVQLALVPQACANWIVVQLLRAGGAQVYCTNLQTLCSLDLAAEVNVS